MNQQSHSLESMPEWQALCSHFEQTKMIHMRDMFAEDTERFNKFSIKHDDLLFDYSKNRINETTIKLLTDLANACGLAKRIQDKFSGEKINSTEQRAVLHSALRSSDSSPLIVDGIDIRKEVSQELGRIAELSEKIRSGQWLGHTGKPITDIVNIGIGGSYLGPQMVTEALSPYCSSDLNLHFVANLDEDQIDDCLAQLNPETCLFIICSKTFTTQETMFNANTARNWFLNQIKDEDMLAKHFIAVSTNLEATLSFGIHPENVFKMWDWVGGRYSIWSAIGVSVMVAIGSEHFVDFLSGAEQVDKHLQEQPFAQNIPVLMGLLGIWYNNFYQAESYAVLPYDQHLHRLPAYLQQADMESNGKSVKLNGDAASYSTGPIIFGELGNPGQHAFYQLLHQGTKLVPIDVLAAINRVSGQTKHQDALISNVLAQTEALMLGKTKQQVTTELQQQGLDQQAINALLSHKEFVGNRPSNTFLYQQLDPKTLGKLIALYEHKIFVQGVIWNINSFDQWGVELGKQLAKNILTELQHGSAGSANKHDSSTANLMNYYKTNQVQSKQQD
jgi:glucose-6-phosphate isomerase